jgi:nucleoside-diphosphate-sugar epimerase
MRVLVAGAGGVIGSILWEKLDSRYELHGIDLHGDRSRGIRRADVRRARSIRNAFDQVEAVVDLATGSTLDLSWDQVEADISGRVNILEAARLQGVRRYIFASSNHVTGMYEFDQPYASIVAGMYDGLDPASVPLVGTDWPIRPDSPYGAGKAFSEAAARYYSDRYGISCICLRIGTVLAEDRPKVSRHYATLLTHSDLGRLVGCALGAPSELRYGVYYGVSANTWRFWDISNATQELGYEPQDDAERFRSDSDRRA